MMKNAPRLDAEDQTVVKRARKMMMGIKKRKRRNHKSPKPKKIRKANPTIVMTAKDSVAVVVDKEGTVEGEEEGVEVLKTVVRRMAVGRGRRIKVATILGKGRRQVMIRKTEMSDPLVHPNKREVNSSKMGTTNNLAIQELQEETEVEEETRMVKTEVEGSPTAVAEAVEEVEEEAVVMVPRPAILPTRHLKPRIDNSEDPLRPHTGVDSLKSPPEPSSMHQLNFCQNILVG